MLLGVCKVNNVFLRSLIKSLSKKKNQRIKSSFSRKSEVYQQTLHTTSEASKQCSLFRPVKSYWLCWRKCEKHQSAILSFLSVYLSQVSLVTGDVLVGKLHISSKLKKRRWRRVSCLVTRFPSWSRERWCIKVPGAKGSRSAEAQQESFLHLLLGCYESCPFFHPGTWITNSDCCAYRKVVASSFFFLNLELYFHTQHLHHDKANYTLKEDQEGKYLLKWEIYNFCH